MPLREDLLEPIAESLPSGEDLHYDKVFDQIKEARREDIDDMPAGDWAPAQAKKADHPQVIKLAGETLSKKSKDIRLVEALIESQIKLDGLSALVPSIELLRSIQEKFWPTSHPQIEENEDLELRALAVEVAMRQLTAALRTVPLTKNGLSFEDYLESRHVGYEKDATTDAKQEAWKDAIAQGKLTAEDFDQAFAATPKSFYVDANAVLEDALAATERLEEFQQEKYGDNAPNISRLRASLEEVQQLVASLLAERRKTEPDPVAAAQAPATAPGGATADGGVSTSEVVAASSFQGVIVPGAAVSQLGEAYQLVVRSAELLFNSNPMSPVAYLVCVGLRFGETRLQGPTPAPGFAVGPTPEMRHSMRTLAARGEWAELLRTAIPILACECSRAWLDLHRYIWRAGQETGAVAISAAVVGTVRSLLEERPEMRHWVLEDDTGAANSETQQWLDTVVLRVEQPV